MAIAWEDLDPKAREMLAYLVDNGFTSEHYRLYCEARSSVKEGLAQAKAGMLVEGPDIKADLAEFGCEYCYNSATRFRQDEDGSVWVYCDECGPSDAQPLRDGVKPGEIENEVHILLDPPRSGGDQGGHVLLTPQTCTFDHEHWRSCPVCDGGLGVCSKCGTYEAGLDGPCGGSR